MKTDHTHIPVSITFHHVPVQNEFSTKSEWNLNFTRYTNSECFTHIVCDNCPVITSRQSVHPVWTFVLLDGLVVRGGWEVIGVSRPGYNDHVDYCLSIKHQSHLSSEHNQSAVSPLQKSLLSKLASCVDQTHIKNHKGGTFTSTVWTTCWKWPQLAEGGQGDIIRRRRRCFTKDGDQAIYNNVC